MEGDYTRHSFAYVVPPQEPGAGQTVNMILVNEETVQSRLAANGVATGDGPVLVWHHCKRPVS
ncbi:MAG: hypothetical protein HY246_09755 [Proteobacteria bacterium]|nr:hypothetical protein [Pseudomonadota bacterium]